MQRFQVEMRLLWTGETWTVATDAEDPTSALTKVLRRRLWCDLPC